MDWDYIVVGGGSAGATLAARLSAPSKNRVLLIEAGRNYTPDNVPPEVKDTFFRAVYNPRNLWPGLMVHWQPVPHNAPETAAARRYEQARIIGGGSSINAMIALRGVPGDYDSWAKAGCAGWAFADCLPFFRKLERDLDFPGPLHGGDGPIPVRRHKREEWPPFARAVSEAAAARGMAFVDDMNGAPADGFCRVPMSNLPTTRVSTAIGFLDNETRRRPNLRIVSDTVAEQLVLDGKKVTGVVARGPGGSETFKGREVIVSAGALHSPAVLLRAGIGPAASLSRQGVEVKVDLPGVGENLHDHPVVAVAAFLKPEGMQPASLRPHANLALRLSSKVAGCAAHDLYVTVSNKSSWHSLGLRLAALLCCVYKPYSRGRLTLAAASPSTEPRIEMNMFTDPRDMQRMAPLVRLAHELITAPGTRTLVNEIFPAGFTEEVRALNRQAFSNRIKARALLTALDGPAPLRRALVRSAMSGGREMGRLVADQSALEEWIRATATGFYHPVGTCRMGSPDDTMTVVDTACRVRGVGGLRVVDASVMPEVPSANTNIPTIMVAEKVADAILGGS
jgi:5-(hydroxymethyl)furfural/furfural oxidase